MDVNKILEMLEKEDKPFAPGKRETVAKESLVSACNGDYDAINRLLEEDIAIDERSYQKSKAPIKKPMKGSKESFDKKPAKECDATPVGVENPIPSPVRKKEAKEEDLSDKLLKELQANEATAEVDWAYDDDVELQDDLKEQFEGYNIQYSVDKEEGPSGWPVIKLTGDLKEIKRWLSESGYNNGYPEDDDLYITSEEACAAESTTDKSPMKGTTDDIVHGKPINFKSQNNKFETSESKEVGNANAMNEKQTQKAAGEEVISVVDDSLFPQDMEFDEEAFAELYGLDPETVNATYVAEEDNIPEHIEIRFKEGENDVLLKLMDDGSLVEEVNAEIVEEPRFEATITQDEDGNYILLISDATVANDSVMSEEDGVKNSEGDLDSVDEAGKDRTDEFVEGAGLDLDSEYSVAHKMKPAKNAADKIKDPTVLPVNK